MSIERDLGRALLEAHPEDGAAVLESLPGEEAAEILAAVAPQHAGRVVARMTPIAGTRALETLSPDTAAAAVSTLALPIAASLVRRLPPERQAAILGEMPDGKVDLSTLLEAEPDSAAAWMDPSVSALVMGGTVQEALDQIRAAPAHHRYNVYVIDRAQRLHGVVTLHELLTARPESALTDVVRPARHRVRTTAKTGTVVTHPGWQEVHALPVVDDDGRYVGAIRYRTLRQLQARARGAAHDSGSASRALGDLFWTGLVGLVDAFTVAPAGGSEPDRGES